MADHKNKRYLFESTRTPNVFWVNLADLDISPGPPIKKLTLTDGTFQPTEPFKFLPETVE